MSIMACAVRIRSFCAPGMCQLIFKADGWTRPSPGNFIGPAVCGDASLAFVIEMPARRFSRLPAQGGPPGGAAAR